MNIKAESLSFRYRKGLPLVLNDVSFDIPEGSLTVLLGLNGCGKTTLLNIIGLLDRSTSGEYLLNGENVASIGLVGPDRIDYKQLIIALYALLSQTKEQRLLVEKTGGKKDEGKK